LQLTEVQDGRSIAQCLDEDGMFRRHVISHFVQERLALYISELSLIISVSSTHACVIIHSVSCSVVRQANRQRVKERMIISITLEK